MSVDLLINHLDGEGNGFVVVVISCLGRDTGLRRRSFPNLFPWNWRCAPISIHQGTEPSLCFGRDRFDYRRSRSGPYRGICGSKCGVVSIVTSGMREASAVVAVRIADGSGDRTPSIGVWGDEQT